MSDPGEGSAPTRIGINMVSPLEQAVIEVSITPASRKVETSLTITADRVRCNHYGTFYLGTHDLSGWRSIWFKLAGNPQNVRQVLVDRIYLTHESKVTE